MEKKTKDGYAQKLARPGEKRVNGGKDFGKRQVLSLKWNSEGVMDGESGESMEEEEETDVGRGESQRQRDWYEVVGENLEVGSRDEVKHIKRNSQRFVEKMVQVETVQVISLMRTLVSFA